MFSPEALKGAAKSITVWLGVALLVLPTLMADTTFAAAVHDLLGASAEAIITKLLALGVIVNRFRTAQSLAEK